MELSKTKASQLSSLSTKKMRRKHGIFLVEGEKCIFDMLDRFKLECLVVSQEWADSKIGKEMAKEKNVLVAPVNVIKKISSLSTPSDILGVFQLPSTPCPDVDENKLYLLLDGVQDPGNLGTIIRTADWFGIEMIFASTDTADVFNPKTVQATMGSLSRVAVHYTDLSDLIVKNRNMPVYGTLLEGKDIFKSQIENRGFIIMGNEGNGISESVRNYITHPLFIPPYNPAAHGESLNVAIATAITLSYFRFGKV